MTRYTGPAKPVPTEYVHPIGSRPAKAVLLGFSIIMLLLDLFYWRPM